MVAPTPEDTCTALAHAYEVGYNDAAHGSQLSGHLFMDDECAAYMRGFIDGTDDIERVPQ